MSWRFRPSVRSFSNNSPDLTTTANTLLVNSLSPLFAAALAWVVLRQPIGGRMWLAIFIAIAGMAWMFHAGLAADAAAFCPRATPSPAASGGKGWQRID